MPTLPIDTSTINQEELEKLPLWATSPHASRYHLAEPPGGMGCFMDPPGYPSYFLRGVYTPNGNTPWRNGVAITVLLGHVVEWVQTHHKDDEERALLLEHLYLPLPEEHERVQLWIAKVYAYWHHQYVDDSKGEKKEHISELVSYPVPAWQLANIKAKYDARTKLDIRTWPRWQRKEYLASEARSRALEIGAYKDAAARLATPDNHAAVRRIRRWYPGHVARPDFIGTAPATGPQADWWERYAHLPAPEECPGWYQYPHGGYDGGKSCLTCGLRAAEADPVGTALGRERRG